MPGIDRHTCLQCENILCGKLAKYRLQAPQATTSHDAREPLASPVRIADLPDAATGTLSLLLATTSQLCTVKVRRATHPAGLLAKIRLTARR